MAYDPKSTSLHSEAAFAYQVSSDEYAVGKPEGTYIVLESARRLTARQAELYRDYVKHISFGGPKANAADQPGQSDHECGTAIDVVISLDPIAIRKALINNGWTDNKPAENWHFACLGVSNSAELQATQANLKPQSVACANKIYEVLVAERDAAAIEKKYDEVENEYASAQATATSMQSKKAATKKKIDDGKARITEINMEVPKLKNSISKWQAELTSSVYKCCPNGQPYKSCDHQDLKTAYDASLNVLKGQISKAKIKVSDLASEEKQLTGLVKAAKDDLILIEKDLKTAQTKATALLKDYKAALAKVKAAVALVKKLESEIQATVAQIQTVIESVLSTKLYINDEQELV